MRHCAHGSRSHAMSTGPAGGRCSLLTSSAIAATNATNPSSTSARTSHSRMVACLAAGAVVIGARVDALDLVDLYVAQPRAEARRELGQEGHLLLVRDRARPPSVRAVAEALPGQPRALLFGRDAHL